MLFASKHKGLADFPYSCCPEASVTIYALAGLSEDATRFGIVPEYSKSCGETYSEVAKAFINWMGSSFLVHCYFPKSLESLPSWAPDWSTTSRGRKIICNKEDSDLST